MIRGSGILLHPTSLDGKWEIGTLGSEAMEFVDTLRSMGQKYWQVLPLNPTHEENSPYQALSAFAGNPLLISPEVLYKEGYLSFKDLPRRKSHIRDRVDFAQVRRNHEQAFRKAWNHFRHAATAEQMNDLRRFIEQQEGIADYCLFMALRNYFGNAAWVRWDKEIKNRTVSALATFSKKLDDEILFHGFLQYQFFRQWNALKAYCHLNDIHIIGDNPIYVAYDSAEVWAYPRLFQLDRNLHPKRVAGVPPDCFSADGQLWGNPLYDWDAHKAEHYRWWIRSLAASFEMTDYLRIDHFIGFVRYYSISATAKNARRGQWEKGPGLPFFRALKKHFPELPIIAEDLGAATDEVYSIREKMGFPGMKILQEAFDGNPQHPFLPHRYNRDCLVYTATHDTNTSLQTIREMEKSKKDFMYRYCGIRAGDKKMVWELIRLALESKAVVSIFPIQDIMTLDGRARMNLPGTSTGNWAFRMQRKQLKPAMISRLESMTRESGR